MGKIDSQIRTIHFLHIPKTGGTSMVETARQMRRGNWGRYDDELISVLRPGSVMGLLVHRRQVPHIAQPKGVP